MKILTVKILPAAVLMSACADPAASKPKAQTTAPGTNTVANTNVAAKPTGETASILTGLELKATRAK